jgi:uncharacterized protein
MPVRTSYTRGTPNWVDLQASDQDAAKAFYSGLFGWTYDDQPMPEGQVYSMAMLGEHAVAAIAPQSPEMIAAGAPPMWNTYLTVDSADDTAAKAEAAGGTIAMAPFDVMDAGGWPSSSTRPARPWRCGRQMVGGTTPPQMPGTPSHWHVYFGVADADATVAEATELGGSALVPPFDTPVGRMAAIGDPQGAVFSIIQQAPQPA